MTVILPTMKAEVVVLGMGPGGEEVATRLAEAGLDVVGIEKELLGGECPYWACIPTKMMVRAAGLVAEARRVPGMAGSAVVNADWSPVATRIRDEATDNWDDLVAVERFERAGGRFMRASGVLDGPARVLVGDQAIDVTRATVVATGTRPLIPPVRGLDRVAFWTNREAVRTTSVPRSLIVMGAGAVGCEFAQVFARFGSHVVLLEGEHRVLPTEEIEACELMHEVFGHEGIEVRTRANATSVRSGGEGVIVELSDGSSVSGAQLLVATGRHADLDAINAASLGVGPDAPWLPVDDHLRVPGAERVWGVGDVTGGGFTHVAMQHAGIAVADILGRPGPGFGASSHAIPRVTFTDPEVGAVGLTSSAATAAGINVRTGMSSIPTSTRGWIHKAGNEGFIKLVEDVTSGVLVGATSVGPSGGEVLSMLSVAVHARVPVDRLNEMIYAYPTFHRAVENAVRELRA